MQGSNHVPFTSNLVLVQSTLEKNVKYVYSQQNRYESDVTDVILVSFFLTLAYFTLYPTVSIVDFEQINVYWVVSGSFSFNEIRI